MTRTQSRAAVLLAAAVLALAGPAAYAIFPQLSTPLTGAALGGSAPKGEAKVDQARLPATPGTLSVRVDGVRLPDGTSLDVVLDGQTVGAFRLSGGRGSLSATLPFQVGANARLEVRSGAAVVLSNPGRWKN